ncbi:MAG: gamma-glutamyltransferase family protein, partial [Nocardioidaceae bacterium]
MFTTRPELAGTFGMVSSTHWLASQSGMAVLEEGGNAFDAAVATGLVLQVVEPHLNGPGGEVPVIAWDQRRGEPFVLCGQGVSPAGATIDAFESLGVPMVPGTGLLPACVPGAFGAWMLLLREHGTMRLRDVLRFAIEYAGGGFVTLPRISEAIAGVADLFTRDWPTSAAVWLPNGKHPRAGTLFRNDDLAVTYTRILHEAESASRDRDEQIEAARTCFYEGFVAEAIAEFYATEVMDVTGRPHAGLLTYDDLAGWHATVERPVGMDYRGTTVLKAGPWTQGPAFLQQLALLDRFDVESMGVSSPELIHLVTECAKLAFADREAHYGDPAHVEVPLDVLLSPDYNAARAELVGANAVVEGLHPGTVRDRAPRLPVIPSTDELPDDSALGEPTVRDDGAVRGDTCHLDVADRFGNVVAATPSGGWLQSSPAVAGLGFSVTTRGQMFWLDRDLPNSLAPRKRPRITLSPSLALRDGLPYLAFGTPGGDMQDQWTLLFFLRHVHHDLNLQEAIDAPNWHTTHFPSSFYPRTAEPGRVLVEDRVGEGTVAALRRRGHRVSVEGPWTLGRVSAVSRDRDGLLRAGANPRGMQGYA